MMEAIMQRTVYWRPALLLTVLLVFLIGTMPAWGKKPQWAGDDKGGSQYAKEKDEKQPKGKPEKHRSNDGGQEKAEAYRPPPPAQRPPRHFNDQQQVVINNYYVQQFRSDGCPPGLVKKGKGCVPPGQAKKWQYGRPLPPQVIYYDLPQAVLVQLGPPPSGYKFVRVAQDILMIAVGTGMVMDAIEDIGRVVD
jgi:Ni/Co efflux regulator RcnB